MIAPGMRQRINALPVGDRAAVCQSVLDALRGALSARIRGEIGPKELIAIEQATNTAMRELFPHGEYAAFADQVDASIREMLAVSP